MSKGSFEAILAQQGRLVYSYEGSSMYPLLLPRDLVVIEAVKTPPAVGDIPLYKRENGQYVLHRIIGVHDGAFVTLGDNRTEPEYGVTNDMILGTLTGVIRDGRTISVEDAAKAALTLSAQDLIDLVACVLNGQQPDPRRCATMNLKAVYSIAQLHYLTAVAATAIEQVRELPHAFDQAKKKAIRKAALLDIERTKICAELEKEGIWYLPLKGIVLKRLYPKSFMREMNDNDILCDNSRMDTVREIMTRLGYTCESYGEYHHDSYQKPPVLEFEMHRFLMEKKTDPVLFDYYNGIGERLIACGGCSRRMTDEDFYLYMIAHTFKHYSNGGAGLRSLADIDVFCRRFDSSLDRGYIDAELEKMGLSEYERSVRTLSHKVFSGDSLDEKESQELEYYILSGANGASEHWDHNHLLKRLGDDSRRSKSKYLFDMIFLSGDSLKKRYPLVYKHKALYPFMIVYRVTKGAVTKPKQLLAQYRRISGFSENNRNTGRYVRRSKKD